MVLEIVSDSAVRLRGSSLKFLAEHAENSLVGQPASRISVPLPCHLRIHLVAQGAAAVPSSKLTVFSTVSLLLGSSFKLLAEHAENSLVGQPASRISVPLPSHLGT